MEITYDAVKGNVLEAKVDGARVDVRWKCGSSGLEVAKSSAHMSADRSLGNQVSGTVKRSMMRELLNGVIQGIGRLIGGAGGRIARDVTYTAGHEVARGVDQRAQYTEKSRRDAIVQAFKSVEDKFTWDEGGKRFVAK